MTTRWPLPIRMLHWATAILAAVMIPAAFAAEALTETDTDRAEAMVSLHIAAGLFILMLTLMRLACRAAFPAPRAEPGWRGGAAWLRTILFYSLLLALPATGILKLTLSGLDVSAFDVTLIPSTGRAPDLARALNRAHEWLGKAFIGLAVLHVLGAVLPHGKTGETALRRIL